MENTVLALEFMDSDAGKKATEAFPVDGQALALVLAIFESSPAELNKQARFKTPEGK